MFFLFTGKERRGEEKSRLSECGMLELFYAFKAEVKQFLIEDFKIKSYCISSGKFVRYIVKSCLVLNLLQAHYSTGRVAASFTSTAMDPTTQHEAGKTLQPHAGQ